MQRHDPTAAATASAPRHSVQCHPAIANKLYSETMVHLWMREEVKEHEKRTAITPADCAKLIAKGFQITVEKFADRCVPDGEYERYGDCCTTLCAQVPSVLSSSVGWAGGLLGGSFVGLCTDGPGAQGWFPGVPVHGAVLLFTVFSLSSILLSSVGVSLHHPPHYA
jgi:hypothetical protein